MKIAKSMLVCVMTALGASAAVADGAGNSGPLDKFELGRFQYCGSDADCIHVTNGCCDCANGGEDVAINKDYQERFRQKFDCLNVACTMRAAEPPCGSGVVSCVDHKCRYFPQERFANPEKPKKP